MRIRTLHFIFIILFILLSTFLFYLQVIKGPMYRELSCRNSIRLLGITAPRGIIYDRNNKIVADNALGFGVFIVPQEVIDLDGEIKILSDILGISQSALSRNYKRNYQAPFAPCELAGNIPKEKAILVEQSRLDMPGVLVKEFPSRRYLYKDAFAHVVGYTGKIDRDELELFKSYGYSVRDTIGKDGVEKATDVVLRGRNGGMQVQVDNRGRQVEVLNFKRPKNGRDVCLTVDAGLQDFIWSMMEGKEGAAVFMDVHTGEILSLVSAPSYDPNDSISKVLNEAGAPLLNRAVAGQYPPGSLFKIIVALAGLESGSIKPDTAFICRGKLNVGNGIFNCWNRDGHGVMVLERAIIESCNVYFYNLGITLGAERILEYARQFGLGRKTGIGLAGEAAGFVPSRTWKKASMGEGWYAGDTVNLAIGQGYLLVTPLQITRLIAAVANGGTLVEPHVLKKVGDVELSGHKKVKLRVKEENLELIRKAMRGVVEDANGTGFRAWSSIVAISAKTGTSQAGPGLRTHAWFAGFAPFKNPEISFVIFLEHGGSGGDIAAMIANKAVEYWYRNK